MLSIAAFLWLAVAAEGDLRPLENILANSSVEADANRDGMPDGWTPMAWESKAVLRWDRKVARTGKASLRIDDPGHVPDAGWKKNSARWVSSVRPVEPGSSYQLEAWIRTKNLTGNASIILSWRRHGNYLGQEATPPLKGTTDWTRVALSVTAPENADEVVVMFMVGYGTGSAWADDIRVSGKSEPLPKIEYHFTDTRGWFPFEFPMDDEPEGQIDLSRFLHRPAGKFGFVQSREDGHLYFENGERARFIGINLGGARALPDHKTAQILAKRFAKYGFNLVRLHSLDSHYAGLIDYSQGTSQSFSSEALDRLDYFIAELKKQGIYVYLDMLDYRMFRTADGVPEGDLFTHNWAGSSKGASIFVPRMIELQKDYATKLLTHKNRYTGLRYVDEPAIAMIETTNENSIFYFLTSKDLSRPYYRRLLQERWNQWLRAKYTNDAALRRAWTGDDGRCELEESEKLDGDHVLLPRAELVRFSRGSMPDRLRYRMGPRRMQDVLHFFAEIQDDYFRQMHEHFRKLGVRVPITGTNQVFTVAGMATIAARNEATCGNQYWFHPVVHAKPFARFANLARVRSDFPSLRGPVPVLARNTAAGRPHVVTEFNYPWPNEFRCEGTLLTTAYALLQDWDGLLFFVYHTGERELQTFGSQSDPARWGLYPAAVAMFHRHDVATARNEIHMAYAAATRWKLIPDERSAPYSAYRYLPFLSKVRNVFLDGSYQGKADAVLAATPEDDVEVPDGTPRIRFTKPPWAEWQYEAFVEAARRGGLPGYEAMKDLEKRFQSDTGELTLDYGKGYLRIDAARSQALIGYLREAGTLRTRALAVNGCQVEFASISATSLDDAPIGRSRRLLVTAVGRAENTGQGFWPRPVDPKSWSPHTRWMLPEKGRRPVIAQPIDARVWIRVPASACTVYPLDPAGRRMAPLEDVQTRPSTGGFVVRFNPALAKSIWFEVVAE